MDPQDRPSSPDVDEALETRRRLVAERERAKLVVVIGGISAFLAILTVVQQPSSAKSYADDSPGYWIALATVFAVIGAGMIVGGVRVLRGSRSRD